MKEIEVYLWWRSGKLDGDGYETDIEITEEDYEAIVGLIKDYATEKSEADDEYIDSQDFTENYLCEKARPLYDKIEKILEDEFKTGAKESASEWFDQETEGCTLEEYINNTYYWGFYLSEELDRKSVV